jgi:hypothetical protein
MSQDGLNINGGQLARAYSIAVAYPENVPGYISENKTPMEAEYAQGSFGRYFIDCLRQRAISSPDPGDVNEHAMEIASRAGAPQLGPQLAQDFLRERTDMMLLAGYLEDIIGVIPSILQGNTNSYHSTTLYSAMRYVWQSAAGLVQPDFLQRLRQMTFELNEWYVDNLMDTVRFDYLESIWPRTAAILEETVEKYETAKAEGDSVKLIVQASILAGSAKRFAPLLGLTDNEIQSMNANLNVDPLVEWLQDNGWID